MKVRTRKGMLGIHRWFGLIGGLWIIVLGFSGLMLDHRDDWGWAWRTQVPHALLPHHTEEALTNRHITLAQVDPNSTENWIVGGPLGLWESSDSMESWEPVGFSGLSTPPMVFSITLDETTGWNKLWLATDDGIWSLRPGSETPAKREGLAGRYLTGHDNGSFDGELVLIENRTNLLRWQESAPDRFDRIDLDGVSVNGLPEKVSWSRFIFDMHLGRALTWRPLNMAINDYGAIAMILLAITGFARWFVRRRRKAPRNPMTRVLALNWLYNIHAPIIGLLAIVPLIYLSLTGIIFNHRFEWMQPLVTNKVERTALPNVYDFPTLDREISHVIAYPGDPDRLTIGTRLGVLTSIDGGRNWDRETGVPAAPGFVWALKRHEDEVFLGGLGGPSFVRKLSDTNSWSMIPGLMGMPSDAARVGEDWYIISGPRMFTGDIRESVEVVDLNLPNTNTKPLMLVMFELHNGGIIADWFRYVLDLMAIFLVGMTITGPILWWRRRWAKTRLRRGIKSV